MIFAIFIGDKHSIINPLKLIHLLTYPCYSYFEELILVLIRNRQGWFWKSLASGKEKREGGFRYEGDVKG